MSSSSASTPPEQPRVVEDCLGVVRLLSDGTVTRAADLSAIPLVSDDVPSVPPVQWKDVVYDAAHSLRLSVYRPTAGAGGRKLSVLVYFHGGGFCIGSFAVPNFHAGALRRAPGTRALRRLPPRARAPPPRGARRRRQVFGAGSRVRHLQAGKASELVHVVRRFGHGREATAPPAEPVRTRARVS
jgi:hypothetical protein